MQKGRNQRFITLSLALRLTLLAISLHFAEPSCAQWFRNSNGELKSVTYYWKEKDGKKALAVKVKYNGAEGVGKNYDKEVTPYKYDATYGGKSAWKVSTDFGKLLKLDNNRLGNLGFVSNLLGKEYFKGDAQFFDEHSIAVKKIKDGSGYFESHVIFAVRTDEGYGFITETGEEIIPCKYAQWDYLGSHRRNESDFVECSWEKETINTYIQLLTKEGKWQCAHFSDGKLAKAKDAMVDHDFDEVRRFYYYWECTAGGSIWADVRYDDKRDAYKGKDYSPSNVYLATRKGDKWGVCRLVDGGVEECVPCQYDESSFRQFGRSSCITLLPNHFYMVKDGVNCLLNRSGEVVLTDDGALSENKISTSRFGGTLSAAYVTSSGKRYNLEHESFENDKYDHWLGWEYDRIFVMKDNDLYGLHDGREDSTLLSCEYKSISFDEDKTGFLSLTLANGQTQTACLTANADRVIILGKKEDILKHSKVTSDKDGYKTYRLGDGYGFACVETGLYTAPIFTPDESEVINPQQIPLCQFHRGDKHGAFIGNRFFAPLFQQSIKNSGDTLFMTAKVPKTPGTGTTDTPDTWTEMAYKEKGGIKYVNSGGQWIDLITNDLKQDAKSIYLPLDSLFKEFGYEGLRGAWCYDYALGLWIRNDYHGASNQFIRLKDEFGYKIPDEKKAMQSFYNDWAEHAASKGEYTSAIIAINEAQSDGYAVDSNTMSDVFYKAPLHYAANGQIDMARKIYRQATEKFGLAKDNSYINLIESTYNTYLARKEEDERRLQEAERQRQLELQRQQEEESQRQLEWQKQQDIARQQRRHAISNALDALSSTLQTINNAANRKNNKTATSYNNCGSGTSYSNGGSDRNSSASHSNGSANNSEIVKAKQKYQHFAKLLCNYVDLCDREYRNIEAEHSATGHLSDRLELSDTLGHIRDCLAECKKWRQHASRYGGKIATDKIEAEAQIRISRGTPAP